MDKRQPDSQLAVASACADTDKCYKLHILLHRCTTLDFPGSDSGVKKRIVSVYTLIDTMFMWPDFIESDHITGYTIRFPVASS